MPPSDAPRVLHVNDCASVGLTLVEAAARVGHTWDYLGPTAVRPSGGFSGGITGRVRALPYLARRWRALARTDVAHVHYATSAPLVRAPLVPRRPYVLHLHGSDIRVQWRDPATHALVQGAVDGASAVYYTSLDTAENARRARADARYMPVPVDADALPPWRPGGSPLRVVFCSRWDESKGVGAQLGLVARLRVAVPHARLEGLDWGDGAAEAARLGVALHPRTSRRGFHALLAGADVVVGQATGMLGVSELEAMAIGAPVAALGRQLTDPGSGAPPVLQGSPEEVVEQVAEALEDPTGTSGRLGGPGWVRQHHAPEPWVRVLLADYRAAAGAVT